MNLSGKLIQGTGSYEVKELTTQDAVLKHLDVGTKYLECTSGGTVAFPSDQAYGEWEFDLYKGADANTPVVFFISNLIQEWGGGITNCYEIIFFADETVYLNEDFNTVKIQSASSYIAIDTWYRIKITRTLDGEFYLYIRGGAFGNNDWTLVSVSGGSGSNPATDNTNIESQYFVLDFDTGDRISNIITRKAVSQ